MKKTYRLEDLDCASCAAKIEDAVSKLDHVNSCGVNFMTQKLTIDIDDNYFDQTMKSVQKVIKKVDSDCSIFM